MDKKAKNMSIAIDPEMQSLLKVSAKKLGWSTSELIRTLVTRYLDLVVNEDEKVSVVITVESDFETTLKSAAEKLNITVSEMVQTLVHKYLDLLTEVEKQVPVILRIPGELKGDAEALKTWLEARIGAIINKLSPKKDES
jgi:antitoxin component of RelBE/YafQ-DinJ toxin-antitoxin module